MICRKPDTAEELSEVNEGEDTVTESSTTELPQLHNENQSHESASGRSRIDFGGFLNKLQSLAPRFVYNLIKRWFKQ